jgi:hypothetical protein
MMVDVLIVLAPFLSFAKGKGDRGGGGVGWQAFDATFC